MAGAKREPSSLVHITTSIGCLVLMSQIVQRAHYLKRGHHAERAVELAAVGCVSRWLPTITGGSVSSVPDRRANIEPMRSTVTVQPAFCTSVRTDRGSGRPDRSASAG